MPTRKLYCSCRMRLIRRACCSARAYLAREPPVCSKKTAVYPEGSLSSGSTPSFRARTSMTCSSPSAYTARFAAQTCLK
eukprot:623605-Rhodomonas_salina.2